jgi:hypothetical protein
MLTATIMAPREKRGAREATASPRPSDLVLQSAGEVPARAAATRFRADTAITAEVQALALRPELQPGVKSIEVTARRPDGGTEVLLFADHVPLDWPTPYIFQAPVRLPKGSVLSVTAYYDNITDRPQPGGFRLTMSKQ